MRRKEKRCAALAIFLAAVLLWPVQAAFAHPHENSKIRFRAYSQAAFDTARKENKLVLMIMSAVWCFWCKTYNQGALSDPAVAAYLNKRFVSVFVDIDKRANLKRKYLRGVPTTVVFAPDGKFVNAFAGVVTPKDLLWYLRKAEEDIARAAPAVKAKDAEAKRPAGKIGRKALLREVDAYLEKFYDARNGGFGEGKKYPLGWVLSYFLDRYEKEKERRYLNLVEKTLRGVLRGLYDRVDGGFFRYATRRNWKRPRTEKISAVNGALLPVLYRASRIPGGGRYKEAEDRTAAYLIRRLFDPEEGGFFGSQSARGWYYLLDAEGRKEAAPPPVNRVKYAAWNAQVVLGFLDAGRIRGSGRWRKEVLRSLDFIRERLLTKDGVRHEWSPEKKTPPLLGQLENNVWVALALVEGYLAHGRKADRGAARRVLDYSLARLFDEKRGVFVEWNNPKPGMLRREEQVARRAPIDLNGVMALALLRMGRRENDRRYLGAERRVLMNFTGQVRETLSAGGEWDDDGKALEKVVFLLRAYDLFLERT